jgi:hypothetical protein
VPGNSWANQVLARAAGAEQKKTAGWWLQKSPDNRHFRSRNGFHAATSGAPLHIWFLMNKKTQLANQLGKDKRKTAN